MSHFISTILKNFTPFGIAYFIKYKNLEYFSKINEQIMEILVMDY